MSHKYRIPFQIIELDINSFHLLIEVKLNDMPVNMIIDTGASRTVFDKSLPEKNFHQISENFQSTGIFPGPVESLLANAKSLKIGNLILQDFQVVLIDLQGINTLYSKATGKEIHGFIGSDFLFLWKAVIDYSKSMLILTDPA